jgi:site-specific recombinase XerD
MASVRFYLRSKKTDPALIMGRLYHSGTEFPFSTGYSVSPKFWSQEAQRVSAKERAADDINTHLADKRAEVLALHDRLKREKRLSNSNLKQELEGKNMPATNLYEHIERVLQDVKRRKEKKEASRSLYAKYKMCAERLKEFAGKNPVDFEHIDLHFYNQYVAFLRAVPLAENTIGAEIKRLKRFLKLAEIQGINTTFIYRSTEFKAPDKRVKHITLSEGEVQALWGMALSGHLERARDLFIIGCRTGLRVSDYNKCVGDSVESTGLICIDETEKTGEAVYIPMHWQVKSILDKYDGLPPLITDQKLNVYLKELCRLAGFTQTVKETREGVNRPKESNGFCKKYELITTHTARRSCATNMYLAGFDLYFIQGILGHTKIETTIRYLGVTRKLVALRERDNPYFKNSVTDYVAEK